MPSCPECGSQRIWKDGIRHVREGKVQRFLCRSCGYRFSEPTVKVNVFRQLSETSNTMNKLAEPRLRNGDFASKEIFNEFALPRRENISSHSESTTIPTVGKDLYAFHSNSGNCRVCASEREAKNLVEVESRTEKQAAGATTKPTEADVKGKIIEYAWWMKKQGYAETTITMYTNVVGVLAKRGSNIYNPDSVKDAIARQQWSEARKESAIAAYTLFLKMAGGHWEPPKCHPTRKIPFVPTEEEIDALIASCGGKTSTFLQLLKETAMRLGEANSLRWIDIDLVRKVVTLNRPEKGSEPRIFKVSSALMDMINALPRTSERVFGKGSCASKKSTFLKSRKNLANKLKNPRLLKITFHTLRHWKATVLYHQTKDILYVQKFLGHKRIEDTMLYIQVAETIFKEATDEFTVRVSENPTEIKELLEVGFEYVCEKDGLVFFRKRK